MLCCAVLFCCERVCLSLHGLSLRGEACRSVLCLPLLAGLAWLQVKRMRSTLFETLISQDVAFFDRESVGDLTSRLGSDAQSVSHIISIDLNIILRNTLQASSLLPRAGTQLQPLAFSTSGRHAVELL